MSHPTSDRQFTPPPRVTAEEIEAAEADTSENPKLRALLTEPTVFDAVFE